MKSKQNSISTTTETISVRLDKWLWACRFYKTRAIAKAAIEGGKVHYEGTKPKPSKLIQIGDEVKLRQGFDEKTIKVVNLSNRRQSATIAQTLYQETDRSIQMRQEIANLRKLSAPSTQGKPDKKQRRQIHRFRNIMSEQQND
ncbi:MAG: RNA-binding protein [Kangiellaceae bacterium]|nr:RNA-binding protein [Kangiellaceae bacterium]